jgi:hypothetical protein
MSSLESRERTQVDEGVDVFSKLEGEIREHVGSMVQKVSGTSVQEVENLITEQRPSEASNMSSLETRERTQVDEGVDVFSKLEGEIREHVGSMVQKVSGTSVQEVENLITEQRPSETSNMSSLETRERTQVDEGVGVFSKLEGEIRKHVGSVVQKVAGTSVQEVENLISELQILRGKLQNEAARVQREIRDYAVLIQGAKKSITTISGSLSFWKDRDAPKISA